MSGKILQDLLVRNAQLRCFFLCSVMDSCPLSPVSIWSYFGLKPDSPTVLSSHLMHQEFTPIGRGFIVTLRGRILDVRRRKRERAFSKTRGSAVRIFYDDIASCLFFVLFFFCHISIMFVIGCFRLEGGVVVSYFISCTARPFGPWPTGEQAHNTHHQSST